VIVAAVIALAAAGVAQSPPPVRSKGLTEVEGLKVGHYTLTERPTGCTVVLIDGEGAPGGVSQRGGAPGTRETDLLGPLNLVDKVNAIVLAGGSAYGLDAAQGVVRYLEERKIGWNVGAAGVVPIVPSAILFDLGFGGDPKIRPTADCGYRAAGTASDGAVADGVRRTQRPRKPVISHQRDATDFGLGEARVGRHDGDGGVFSGARGDSAKQASVAQQLARVG